MLGSVAGSEVPDRHATLAAPFRISKHFLNALAERAAVATDRSRFAALPQRYLDDVGMTEAERAAALGFDESSLDGWRVVASHL